METSPETEPVSGSDHTLILSLPDELLSKIFEHVYDSFANIVVCPRAFRVDVRIFNTHAKAAKFMPLTRACRRFHALGVVRLYQNLAITNSTCRDAYRWDKILTTSILLHRSLRESPVLRSHCRKLHLWPTDPTIPDRQTEYSIYYKMTDGKSKLLIKTLRPEEKSEGVPEDTRGTLTSVVDDAARWLTRARDLFLIVYPSETSQCIYPMIDTVMQTMPSLSRLEVSGLLHEERLVEYTDPQRPKLLKVLRSLVEPSAKAAPSVLRIYDENSIQVCGVVRDNKNNCNKVNQLLQQTSLNELYLYYTTLVRLPFEFLWMQWPKRLKRVSFACIASDHFISYIVSSPGEKLGWVSADIYMIGLSFIQSLIHPGLKRLTITGMDTTEVASETDGWRMLDFPEYGASFRTTRMLINWELSEVIWKLESKDMMHTDHSTHSQSFLPKWLNDLSGFRLTGGRLSTLKNIHVDIVRGAPVRDGSNLDNEDEDRLLTTFIEASDRFMDRHGIELTWSAP